MKRTAALLVLVLLVGAGAVFAQTSFGLKASYYSNNSGPGSTADQVIRIVNTGATGSPLSANEGTVCANIYVFDANQEMVACCSCPITANGLRTISVANNLTNNPVTSVVPINGDVVVYPNFDQPPCDPTQFALISPLGDTAFVGFQTHLQIVGGATQITETLLAPIQIGFEDALFQVRACQFARYLGSGKGVCTCGTGS